MGDPAPWLLALLAALTVYRVARLVTADTITEPARKWVEAKAVAEGGRKLWIKLDDLVVCPWCVSVWAGAVVAPVTVWWGDNRVILAGLLALAASAVAGLLSTVA